MYSPSTVANYFVKKYGEVGDLTPMKLLKLTYIAQGWYLALSNNQAKLINEDVQAWDYGPVFPSLYQSLKKYGKTKITNPIPQPQDENVTEQDAKFLDKIWSKYGQFNGVILSAMTHTSGTPWKDSFKRGQNVVIDSDKIYEHYNGKLNP